MSHTEILDSSDISVFAKEPLETSQQWASEDSLYYLRSGEGSADDWGTLGSAISSDMKLREEEFSSSALHSTPARTPAHRNLGKALDESSRIHTSQVGSGFMVTRIEPPVLAGWSGQTIGQFQ